MRRRHLPAKLLVVSPKPQPAGLDPKRDNHASTSICPTGRGTAKPTLPSNSLRSGTYKIFEALLKPSTVAPALLVAPSNRMVLPKPPL